MICKAIFLQKSHQLLVYVLVLQVDKSKQPEDIKTHVLLTAQSKQQAEPKIA
jgi:hypothetical protein